MSDQSQDISDVYFATSNSSPALIPTRPVSPRSPVARPNFLPRLRTPLAVTQAVKGNSKDHNVSTPLPTLNYIKPDMYWLKLQTDHISDKLVDKKSTPIIGRQPRSPSPDPALGSGENIPPISRLRKRCRLVAKEERDQIMEMSMRLRAAWDGPGEVSRDRRAA